MTTQATAAGEDERVRSRGQAVGSTLARVGAGGLAILELLQPGNVTLSADGAAVALVLLAVALSWRTPRLAAASAVAGGVVGFGLADQQLLVPSLAGLAGMVVLLGHRTPAVPLVAAVAAAVAGGLLLRDAPVLFLGGWYSGAWLTELVVATAIMAAVAGITIARRNRRDAAVAEQRLRDQRVAAERRDAVLAERARIAREMHDLVAHSVSVIAVLAETAPFTVPHLPPEGEKRFAEIATSARDALGELRDLLSVLRREESCPPGLGTRPAPDLNGLHRLLTEHQRSGGTVLLTRDGELGDLPVAVQVAAHRIVQEALTNVRRHTDGASATVDLDKVDDCLRILVRDTGPRLRGSADPGHGLTGMRERAEALGGTLDAGPDGEGFSVTVLLPFGGHRP